MGWNSISNFSWKRKRVLNYPWFYYKYSLPCFDRHSISGCSSFKNGKYLEGTFSIPTMRTFICRRMTSMFRLQMLSVLAALLLVTVVTGQDIVVSFCSYDCSDPAQSITCGLFSKHPSDEICTDRYECQGKCILSQGGKWRQVHVRTGWGKWSTPPTVILPPFFQECTNFN